jgi:lysophospholipase L1-like esterase
MVKLRHRAIVFAVLLAAGACGGTTPIQPPPPSPELQLSCPMPLVREAATPQGVEVHWDAPVATGGRQPSNIQCVPSSGSVFEVGESTVRCSATDADMRQASCTFGVTVRVSKLLAWTNFVAFGDSITEGQVLSQSLGFAMAIEPLEAYPYKLEQILRSQYPAEDIRIANKGFGGEAPPQGVVRLPGVLDAEAPQVLLLQEGTNGLNSSRVTSYGNDLRAMVSLARQRNINVIIATLLPVGPPHTDSRPTKRAAVIELNKRIEAIAAEFGIAPALDLYSTFEANPGLLDFDGLHPTRAGYTRIAELFADEVIRRYDKEGRTSVRGIR